MYQTGVLASSNCNVQKQAERACAGFLHQLQLWHEMQYVFKASHPDYTTVMMRQLAMRYDAGEELSSITNDLAMPSESAAQVLYCMHRGN